MYRLTAAFEELQASLDVDWTRHWETGPLDSPLVEKGYRLSLDYWERLKLLFLKRQVIDPLEEIHFFREVKPTFCSKIEYCLLLNHGLLFEPLTRDEAIVYWKAEYHKAARFLEEHRAWVYAQEEFPVQQLEQLFRHWHNHQPIPSHELVYMDQDCRSSRDHLLRGWLARQHYQASIEQRILTLL